MSEEEETPAGRISVVLQMRREDLWREYELVQRKIDSSTRFRVVIVGWSMTAVSAVPLLAAVLKLPRPLAVLAILGALGMLLLVHKLAMDQLATGLKMGKRAHVLERALHGVNTLVQELLSGSIPEEETDAVRGNASSIRKRFTVSKSKVPRLSAVATTHSLTWRDFGLIHLSLKAVVATAKAATTKAKKEAKAAKMAESKAKVAASVSDATAKSMLLASTVAEATKAMREAASMAVALKAATTKSKSKSKALKVAQAQDAKLRVLVSLSKHKWILIGQVALLVCGGLYVVTKGSSVSAATAVPLSMVDAGAVIRPDAREPIATDANSPPIPPLVDAPDAREPIATDANSPPDSSPLFDAPDAREPIATDANSPPDSSPLFDAGGTTD